MNHCVKLSDRARARACCVRWRREIWRIGDVDQFTTASDRIDDEILILARICLSSELSAQCDLACKGMCVSYHIPAASDGAVDPTLIGYAGACLGAILIARVATPWAVAHAITRVTVLAEAGVGLVGGRVHA